MYDLLWLTFFNNIIDIHLIIKRDKSLPYDKNDFKKFKHLFN